MTAPDTTPRFGPGDAALAELPTVYRDDLYAGKVALVSGAGSGIGKAIAFLLARLGATLVICGRKREALEDCADKLRALSGREVMTHAMTIRDPGQVEGLLDAAWQRFGGIDVLVNNAGGQFAAHAMDFTDKGWNAVIDTNLNGTWYMMQGAARYWRDAGRPGSIVTIVVVTQQGLHGVAHTIAARSGVVGLSRALAVEWAPLGIRVNCIAPGVIETPGWKVYDPAAIEAYPRSNPMKRNGSTWEVAEACAYLAGPAAAYVTGDVLHVAGGAQLWGETWTIDKPDYFKV